MYCVYAIYNRKHGKIYIGQTKDLKERVILHNSGFFKKSYTAKFDGLWEVIYSEELAELKDALQRERQLKGYQGRQFIKKHIPE